MSKDIRLQEHFEIFKNDEKYIQYFREFALDNLNMNPDIVEDTMEKLLEICKEKNYVAAKYWCYLYLGWCKNIKGNIIKAAEYHMKAHTFFNDKNLIQGLAAACNALLLDYQQMGYLDLAIKNGLQGIEMSDKLQDYEYTAALMISTASVYVENSNYEEAMSLIRAVKLCENKYRPDYEIEINVILASCYFEFNELETAQKYAEDALTIIKNNNMITWKSEAYSIMGQILNKKQLYDMADEVFKKAIYYADNINNKYSKGKTLIRWALCDFNKHDYDAAEKKLFLLIETLKGEEYLSLLNESYYYLSIIYEKKKKYKESLKILKKYYEYKEINRKRSALWMEKLKNKNRNKEMEKYKELYSDMEHMSAFAKKITSNLDKEKCIQTIYDEIKQMFDISVFGIGLFDKHNNKLNYEFFCEDGRKISIVQDVEEGKNLGAYCLLKQTDILINDMKLEYIKYIYKWKLDPERLKNDTRSIIYIPLIINNESIGVITIQSYDVNVYSISQVYTFKILASYISIALQNSKLFNKINHLANYDFLTNMYNRNKILDIGEKLIRDKKDDAIYIAMIDVDHFKNINDTYGHSAGDSILINVAKCIKFLTNDKIHAGRYGGEEFLIIFNNLKENEAADICEEIRKKIEKKKNEISNKEIKVTISVGLTKLLENQSLAKGIIDADRALYTAKKRGRNRVICSKSIRI